MTGEAGKDEASRLLIPRGQPGLQQLGRIGGTLGVSAIKDTDFFALPDDELQSLRNFQIQSILGAILRISLMDISFEHQLELILNRIISIPLLSLESKGCIFLIEGDPEVLVLRAQRELDEPIRTACARVPLGGCLCGRAAASREIVFADNFDARHEMGYEGMPPHCHYCVPIVSGDEPLGVITLYLRVGYSRNKSDEEFLRAVADVLAGIVERKRAAEAILRAHDDLEVRVKERTAELVKANEELRLEIVERKRAEEALRSGEARFRAVAETAYEAIVIVDGRGEIVYWNHAAEVAFGYQAGEIAGKPFVSLLPERFRQIQRTAFERVVATGHSDKAGIVTQGIALKKNGSEFPAELTFSLWKTEEGLFFTGALRDITQRKEAEDRLNRSFEKLRRTLEGTVNAMALTVEIRDPYTAGHQRRVSQLACAIAEQLNVPEDQIAGLRMASFTHDIGKIKIPAEILSKPGHLTQIEFSLIKSHCQVGYDILKTIDFPWPIAQIVLQHHERMDGSGYPLGLKGKDILLEARILAVADVMEAMASHRPYRPALGVEKALEEISKNKGILYDSVVADACLSLFASGAFELDQA